MSGEPWDVPETPEGREKLRALIEEYRASGQKRELGISLTRMASMVKQIGPGVGEDAWGACVAFGNEAIEVLRKTGDRGALCNALNGAHIFLLPKDVRETLSREALSIARELNDSVREGWAIFALAMIVYPNDSQVEGETMLDAIRCFEKANNLGGKATCLQVLGSKRANGRWRNNLEAAKMFEDIGKYKRAARAYCLAAFWGQEDIPTEEAERYLLEAVQMAHKGEAFDLQATTYSQLARLWADAGDSEKEKHYLGLQDGLDLVVFGSRANRLKHDIEMETDLLDILDGKQKREAKKRIRRDEEELRSLDARDSG